MKWKYLKMFAVVFGCVWLIGGWLLGGVVANIAEEPFEKHTSKYINWRDTDSEEVYRKVRSDIEAGMFTSMNYILFSAIVAAFVTGVLSTNREKREDFEREQKRMKGRLAELEKERWMSKELSNLDEEFRQQHPRGDEPLGALFTQEEVAEWRGQSSG